MAKTSQRRTRTDDELSELDHAVFKVSELINHHSDLILAAKQTAQPHPGSLKLHRYDIDQLRKLYRAPFPPDSASYGILIMISGVRIEQDNSLEPVSLKGRKQFLAEKAIKEFP